MNSTVIIYLDLVIPAVILQEYIWIKSLNCYRENKKSLLSTMTISADQIMNYAMQMRSWDLGRVVINFGKNDAELFLKRNPHLFERMDCKENLYFVKIPKSNNMECEVENFIRNLSHNINYPVNVLKTVGLLMKEGE